MYVPIRDHSFAASTLCLVTTGILWWVSTNNKIQSILCNTATSGTSCACLSYRSVHLMAELHARAKSGAQRLRKFGYLSIREILEVTWQSVRPSVQGVSNQRGSLHFLADITHPGRGQLTAVKKQDIRWPVSHAHITGLGVDPPSLRAFLEIFAVKLLFINWSQAQRNAMVTSLLSEVNYTFQRQLRL